MPSWLIPVLVFALSLVLLLLRLPTRSRRCDRLRARAVAGRAVSLPALGGPAGAERRGRVRDDGDALVFWSGRRQPLRLPRGRPAGQARRLIVMEDEADMGEVFVFESQEGARFAVGVVEGYEEAFGALRTTARRTVPATTRIRLALPRWTRWLAGLTLLAAGAVHWLVWTGLSVEAQVTRVVVSSEDVTGRLCSVQWLDGGTQQSATVGCDPAPVSGDRMGIRALGWPLHGSAMGPDGSYEILGLGLPGLALVLTVVAVLLARRTLARPALDLRPVLVSTDPAGQPGGTAGDADGMTFRQLAVAVQAEEGREPTAPPPSRGTVLRAGQSALGAGRWGWAVTMGLVALLAVASEWDARIIWVAGIAAVAVLGYSLSLSVAVFLQIRRLETLPFTSEWDSVAVDTPDGAEFLFLLLGDSPYWMIPMMDRPPAGARVLARGDLRDGGVVQLKIDGHLYQPAGPVAHVDDEMLAVVRADLAAGLHDDRGQPPVG